MLRVFKRAGAVALACMTVVVSGAAAAVAAVEGAVEKLDAVGGAVASSQTVDLAPLAYGLLPYFTEIIVSIALLAGLWLFRKLARHFDLPADASYRNTLESAIRSRVNQFLVAAVDSNASRLQFQTTNELVADIANYAAKTTPDAIKYFGLKPEALKSVVAGRLLPDEASIIVRGEPLELLPAHRRSKVAPRVARKALGQTAMTPVSEALNA